MFAKPKLQLVPIRSCRAKIARVIGIWNCMPRLESSYVSICNLQLMYFVIGSFWRGLHCEGWKFCWAHFCEVPPPPQKKTTYLTAKMAFNKCWFQYWTLVLAMLDFLRLCPGRMTISYRWNGWGADHTGQFWHHPSASPTLIVWKVVGQHLFLNIIPTNFMARTKQKSWCDWGMSLRNNRLRNITNHFRGIYRIHTK